MRYPRAEWKPVRAHSGPMSDNRGLIEHVTDVHNADPHDYFDEPAHEASSTFWVRQDGHVEQYVEVGVRAWAQGAGNDEYDSVETAGMHDEALTDAQVEALAHLYAWGHVHRGWKLQLAEKPGDYGFGWHGMGGQAWGGHFGCPGDKRKAQRKAVIERAKALLDAGHRPPAPQPAPAHHVNAGTDGAHPGKSSEVEALQKEAVHVKADGFWGNATDHALFVLRAVARGGSYSVREAQEVVGAKVDGTWGPKSREAAHAAVKAAQRALGVRDDGAWGPRTEQTFENARLKYRIA
jgi:hypothetical protein